MTTQWIIIIKFINTNAKTQNTCKTRITKNSNRKTRQQEKKQDKSWMKTVVTKQRYGIKNMI